MKRTGKQGMKRTVLGMLMALPLVAQAQTYSKTETIEYHDNTTSWVLGQTAKVTCVAPAECTPSWAPTGIVVSETTYDAFAMPVTVKAYGKVQQTLTYNSTSTVASGQLGTLRWAKDGNNNTTTFANWKRGIPQSITYADNSTQSAVVNDHGWIESVTDENGYKTCYTYDPMGRLASTTYPSETAANTCDGSTWTATTYTWEYRNVAEHGLPAGHWLRRNHTGNHRRNTFYDALWRPVLEHYYDGADTNATIQTRAWAYDAEGRVTFASYPVNALTGGTTGTWTDYDALGRLPPVEPELEHATDLVLDVGIGGPEDAGYAAIDAIDVVSVERADRPVVAGRGGAEELRIFVGPALDRREPSTRHRGHVPESLRRAGISNTLPGHGRTRTTRAAQRVTRSSTSTVSMVGQSTPGGGREARVKRAGDTWKSPPISTPSSTGAANRHATSSPPRRPKSVARRLTSTPTRFTMPKRVRMPALKPKKMTSSTFSGRIENRSPRLTGRYWICRPSQAWLSCGSTGTSPSSARQPSCRQSARPRRGPIIAFSRSVARPKLAPR